ncbi:hypothetical protein F5144DRAFT_190143 [Chaetomium tenue]|uniref:Uncharacterized protein n=1 Tax=Chaetomium tenue TaxID=1854479 RepID=A0ACB7PCR4_9PEZI|nr:hypothetical protein F5144DRAFT_190143 [Chaetomium globosum]
MGTRHLICVFWKGKWFIAQYGQWDGYPEGQGVKIFNFLSFARNVENLKAGLENHIYEPTEDEITAINDECEAWDENRRGQNLPYEPRMFGVNQLYPSLARDTSAGILGMIARAGGAEATDGTEDDKEKKAKKIPVQLGLGFANDTLFCEWAYVVDLDKEVMEVYGGGERKHDGHRFKDVGDETRAVPAFICSFDFSEIYLMKSDQEFLEKVKKACDEKSQDEEEEEDEDTNLEAAGEEDEGAEGSAKGSP